MTAKKPPAPIRNSFGRWLADARHAAGMTQNEIGRRIGLGPGPTAQVSISNWERGARKPGTRAMLKLLAALGKMPSDLPDNW